MSGIGAVGTSETAVSAARNVDGQTGGATTGSAGQVATDGKKIESGTLTKAEEKQLKDGLTGASLSDEELEKLAEKIAAKIKQENGVEGLSKTGQIQKGTCCRGQTQAQVADKTNNANAKLQEANKNYVAAKENVANAISELEKAKNIKIKNIDGTETQDQNAINDNHIVLQYLMDYIILHETSYSYDKEQTRGKE